MQVKNWNNETETVSTEKGGFYVTALGAKCHYMAGPFDSHIEALNAVEGVRDFSVKRDPRAHFMAWGTARILDESERKLGVLNRLGVLDEALT